MRPLKSAALSASASMPAGSANRKPSGVTGPGWRRRTRMRELVAPGAGT